jgi:hypothetical protein
MPENSFVDDPGTRKLDGRDIVGEEERMDLD